MTPRKDKTVRQLILQAAPLFSIADFRRMWAIGGLTGMARWFEFVAIAIYAFELTRSAKLVALLAVIRMLPYVAGGILVGGLADRFNRLTMMRVCLAFMGVFTAFMAAMVASGYGSYSSLVVLSVLSGIFWTVDMPLRRRRLVDAIGPERMSTGLGLDNATMFAARAVGPFAGGVAYELVGMQGALLMIALSFAACFLLTLGLDKSAGMDGGERKRFRDFLPPAELMRDPRFQVALGVTVVYNIWCFPFTSMVPVIAQNDFALTPRFVGALAACDGIGGIIGALFVASLARETTLFQFYYLGTLAFLILVGILSYMLVVAFAVPLLFLIGIASACFSATQYALVYAIAPPDMRGRAAGVLMMFIGSSMIGHYHAGWLFETAGSARAMHLMAIEGIVCLAILGLLWRRAERKRSLASAPSV